MSSIEYIPSDEDRRMAYLMNGQIPTDTPFRVVKGDGSVEPCKLFAVGTIYRVDVMIGSTDPIRFVDLPSRTGNGDISPFKLLYPAKGPDANRTLYEILSNLTPETPREDLAEIIQHMTASEETDAESTIAARLAALEAELARMNLMMLVIKRAKADIDAAIAETTALAVYCAEIQRQEQEALDDERRLQVFKYKNHMRRAALAASLAAPPTKVADDAATAPSVLAAALARIPAYMGAAAAGPATAAHSE